MSVGRADALIETTRLILAPIGVADFEDLQRVWSDPGFTAMITGHPLSPEDVWFRVLRDIGHWSAFGFGNWSMRLKTTGDYVGSVGMFDFRRDLGPAFDAPELGWGLASAFHGQGLARDGLGAALAWIDARQIARTVCMITPANVPSLRLAQRMGYAPYGTGAHKDQSVILLERPKP